MNYELLLNKSTIVDHVTKSAILLDASERILAISRLPVNVQIQVANSIFDLRITEIITSLYCDRYISLFMFVVWSSFVTFGQDLIIRFVKIFYVWSRFDTFDQDLIRLVKI